MFYRSTFAASLLTAALLSGPLAAQAPDPANPQAANPQAANAQPANAGAQVKSPPSYLIGLSIGSQMQGQGFTVEDIETGSFLAGIQDALSEQDPRLNREQLQAASAQLEQMMQTRMQQQQQARQAAGQVNLQKSRAFLAANAKKEGVQTLPSGLQYKVLQEGSGASPTPQDTVRVHYTGRLIDGTVFDSSVERGQPAQFQLNQVIPGWTEGLQKMKVGGKWMLYIPPELGYGERGSQGAIGPNEALIFEVELLDIVE